MPTQDTPGRFVALLRGINVGKGNRIAMKDLQATLEARGLANVRTVLASGNAVFESAVHDPARLARTIGKALDEAHGIDVPVVVKSAGDFESIVRGNPIAVTDANASKVLVVFSQEARALGDLRPLAGLVARDERFAIGKHAAYLLCARGISNSEAAAALLGRAGRDVTTRNAATVAKLQALLRPA